VSVHWWELPPPGAERQAMLTEYQAIGISRIMGIVAGAVTDGAALGSFAEDCRAAGLKMG